MGYAIPEPAPLPAGFSGGAGIYLKMTMTSSAPCMPTTWTSVAPPRSLILPFQPGGASSSRRIKKRFGSTSPCSKSDHSDPLFRGRRGRSPKGPTAGGTKAGPSIHGRAGLTVDRRSDRPSVPDVENVCRRGESRHRCTTTRWNTDLTLHERSDPRSHLGAAHQVPVSQASEVRVFSAIQSSDGYASLIHELVT